MDLLTQEWLLQQQRHDQMENHSLWLKLTVLAIMAATLFKEFAPLTGTVILLGWLLDAIWKAQQQRVEHRLLQLEQAIRDSQPQQGMQFQTAWQANRGGLRTLMQEYLTAALKPTVAGVYLLYLLSAAAIIVIR